MIVFLARNWKNKQGWENGFEDIFLIIIYFKNSFFILLIMAGIFGVFSNRKTCIDDLFFGTFYLQHRAEDYCGLVAYSKKNTVGGTHKGLIQEQFSKQRLKEMKGNYGIGVVSTERQPLSELSKAGELTFGFDGNIINYNKLKNKILKSGNSFSGYHNPKKIKDINVLSKIVSSEIRFEKGIERLVEEMEGDFAVIALKKEGIYAARGWGRKPLVLGKKNGSYAVSSESVSFENTGFEIVRDVEPGEIVFIDDRGIHTIKNLKLQSIKYGTFEWIYFADIVSNIDGRSVERVRKNIGKILAKKYPISADIVAPIPDSGKGYAKGYAEESGLPYVEVFEKSRYSGRSFILKKQKDRDETAKTKLIPIRNRIKGKRIVLVDDSIVRGTQMFNRVRVLKELGAQKVHARIACPPLIHACKYGKTTKKDKDCIARQMPLDKITETLKLDSLNYATVDILEQAIGYSKEKLCLDCWGF